VSALPPYVEESVAPSQPMETLEPADALAADIPATEVSDRDEAIAFEEPTPPRAPAPAIVVVSPVETAAAAVKQEPERSTGRAANDPREVRRREREARLREEGVISGERTPE